MGGIGSDIAVDAADIALVDDEVKEMLHYERTAALVRAFQTDDGDHQMQPHLFHEPELLGNHFCNDRHFESSRRGFGT